METVPSRMWPFLFDSGTSTVEINRFIHLLVFIYCATHRSTPIGPFAKNEPIFPCSARRSPISISVSLMVYICSSIDVISIFPPNVLIQYYFLFSIACHSICKHVGTNNNHNNNKYVYNTNADIENICRFVNAPALNVNRVQMCK